MRQKDRNVCLDVSVKRGAECNTDHHFLCATVRIGWKFVLTPQSRTTTRSHMLDIMFQN